MCANLRIADAFEGETEGEGAPVLSIVCNTGTIAAVAIGESREGTFSGFQYIRDVACKMVCVRGIIYRKLEIESRENG